MYLERRGLPENIMPGFISHLLSTRKRNTAPRALTTLAQSVREALLCRDRRLVKGTPRLLVSIPQQYASQDQQSNTLVLLREHRPLFSCIYHAFHWWVRRPRQPGQEHQQYVAPSISYDLPSARRPHQAERLCWEQARHRWEPRMLHLYRPIRHK